MTHDSTPHRIFKISELTRLIASQLVLISRKSTVNFACACRSLEEPNLSTLWEIQRSLFTLLEVLPRETRKYQRPEIGRYAVRGLDPPPEGLKAQAPIALARGRGGSIAKGLEQSQALRVLDAPSYSGRADIPRRGNLQKITLQFTSWWMVPGVARFVLVHH